MATGEMQPVGRKKVLAKRLKTLPEVVRRYSLAELRQVNVFCCYILRSNPLEFAFFFSFFINFFGKMVDNVEKESYIKRHKQIT